MLMYQRTQVLKSLRLAAALLVNTFLSQGLVAQIRELPSNEESGVDIDRFIGYPSLSHPKITHDALVTRAILTRGNPYQPGEAGAVLEFRKSLAVGTLWP